MTLDEKIKDARTYLNRIRDIPTEAWHYTNRLHQVCDPETVRAILDALDEALNESMQSEQYRLEGDRVWKAIPDEFKLSPSDGGGYDPHLAVGDMVKEIERLRAENARLREALETWHDAWKTGRNEPLVIARDATRAALEGK